MKKRPPKVEWLNRESVPSLPYFCLCTTEAEYFQAMKHVKFKYPPKWINDGGNATTHTLTNEDGNLCCIVCLEIPEGKSKGQVYGLLVHESVHVWQEYCDSIGEKHPSAEFEAYTIQAIAQRLMFSFDAKTLDEKAITDEK